MTLPPGKRLGPYEIVAPLGAGGMGEVWRARDTRLDREVAIKVLPESFARNEQLRARFEREARTISALNHPHICTLHDVGHESGVHFLVMELIEGESLADRLERGPLPLEQVLRAGVEVASGLDAAHRAGIVHRDLKPGNVVLSKNGAKLLDFGLAKTGAEAVVPVSGLTSLRTEPRPLTQEGTILGTFQYMAPEQLEGLEADGRTDIFALGALLYEMATGKRAFEGKTRTSLIAAIVSAQPRPIGEVQPASPPALDHAIRKCLEKDPEDRWQSARDVASELRWIAEAGSQAGVTAPVTLRRKTRERLAWAAAAVALVAALAFGFQWSRLVTVPRPSPDYRFVIHPRENGPRASRIRRVLLSPDGRRLLYSDDAQRGLLIREMDGFESRVIPGSEGAENPFLSPDGAWVGFFADGKIKKVSLAGGDPIPMVDASADSPGAAWGPDGSIVYSPSWTTGLWRVDGAGGQAVQLTTPDRKEGPSSHIWPEFLPDGGVLFTIFGGGGLRDSKVALLDPKTSRYRILFDGAAARYVTAGQLVFYRGGSYHAVPFDLSRKEVIGPETAVLPDVRRMNPLGARESFFAFSHAGLLAYLPGDSPSDSPYSRLAWISRDGRVDPLPFEGNHGSGVSLSPDQHRAAVTRFAGGDLQVWIYDLERGIQERLTRDGQNFNPTWHPDGARVAYTSLIHGSFDMRWSPSDGSSPPEFLLATDVDEGTGGWSPDGRFAIFWQGSTKTGSDIWAMDVKDPKSLRILVGTSLDDGNPAVSPDGRWLAYRSGGDLYVAPYAGPAGRVLIARDAGASHWSSRARELFYIQGGRFMSLRYETAGEAFRPQSPAPLFEVPKVGREPDFAVSGDGTRFLFFVPEPGHQERDEIHLVLNGFDELRRAVPVGKR